MGIFLASYRQHPFQLLPNMVFSDSMFTTRRTLSPQARGPVQYNRDRRRSLTNRLPKDELLVVTNDAVLALNGIQYTRSLKKEHSSPALNCSLTVAPSR